ncbi:hypothetical protein NDU88_006077 [Pleurodeles waltl]|uniref:Uncharacterized protein n=1 Tax=Pleurodeles waltl TaxID=8319 RepID=A0AAV7X352_PLEWA|nr:hypothetical protein NDU88_006077 [Pleurodeles waltl]
MEAEPHSSLQRLRLQTAGSASAGGGASWSMCRVQDVSCKLGRLPTGDAADVRCSGTGWARRGAGGDGFGGVCGGDPDSGAGVCTCGGRHQAVSCILEGCPLEMILVTVVEAAAMQVVVQVVVVAAVPTTVQVAGLACGRGDTSPSPGGSVP